MGQSRMTERRLTGGRLVVATHNKGKLAEMADLLRPFGLDCVSAGSLGVAEPDETGTTFEANAELKARHTATATGLPSLADDSGLCVAALDGDPGVYTANWAGPKRDWARAISSNFSSGGTLRQISGERSAVLVMLAAVAAIGDLWAVLFLVAS